MSDAHFKRLALVVTLVLAILAVALYLVAKTMSPAPIPVQPPVGAVATATPNLASEAPASSTQPRITWSQKEVEVILSPGESTSKDLTFTSNLDLQNLVIEPVPEIAGFLSVQPNSFASVPAGEQQSVHLSITIPGGTAFGTYQGTVHARLGSQTLPQTLKLIVNVWQSFTDSSLGISFKYPAFGQPSQIEIKTIEQNIERIDIKVFSQSDNAFVTQIGLTLAQNTSHISLSNWFEQNVDLSGILLSAAVFVPQKLSNGMDALVLVGPVPNEHLERNGPVSEIYALSPSGNTIVFIKQSQVNDLDLLGYPVDAQKDLLRAIIESMSVP